MAIVLRFRSSKFDPSQEDTNPINPIAGQGPLLWLREQLERDGFSSTVPDTEDWGWFIEVQVGDERYLLGASDQSEPQEGEVDWALQVVKVRRMAQKLLGKNKLQEGDPLANHLETLLRAEPSIQELEVEIDA